MVLQNRLAQAGLELELGELPTVVVTLVIIVTLLSLLSPYSSCAFSSSPSALPIQLWTISGPAVSAHSLQVLPSLSPWMMFCWATSWPDPASVSIKGAQGLAGSCAVSQVRVTQGKQLLSGGAGRVLHRKGPGRAWDFRVHLLHSRKRD